MDKPLHVQVAEALGWTIFDLRHACGEAPEGTLDLERCVYENNLGNFFAIPDYDTDWSAGGPLVERFGITVGQDGGGVREYWIATETPPWWFFHGHEFEQPTGKGDTPLIAVCNLILALKSAGKLQTPALTAR